MTKNKLIITSLAILTIATASAAFADNEGGKMGGQGMMVSIGQNGNVQLRGTLSSVSGNTLNIASWGGTWVVDATNAKLLRKGFSASTGFSEFQNGDWITLLGTVGSGAWSVTAKQVRDESLQVKQASQSGTISNLSGSSFTLSGKEGKTSNVTVNGDAKVWLNGVSSTVSGLSNGLFAQVSGLWNRAQDTILASQVRARTATPIKVDNRNSTSTGGEGGNH